MDYYNYDLELKSLFFRHIAPIESWLKTEIAYLIAHTSENDFTYFHFTTSNLYYDKTKVEEIINKMIDRCDKSHELELRRLYSSEHKREKGIPIWIGIELLTLGELLIFFKCLTYENQRNIMLKFDFKNLDIFKEVLNSLRIVRNICAHNERLWNNSFQSPRKLIRNGHEIWKHITTKRITAYCLASITKFQTLYQSNDLIRKFVELSLQYRIPFESMGFKDNSFEIILKLLDV